MGSSLVLGWEWMLVCRNQPLALTKDSIAVPVT